MPFIHIKSLPFESLLDVASSIEGVTKDFVDGTGIAIEHITVTWTLLPKGHYAVAGKVANFQPLDSHPVLVDLLAPDFHAPEAVENMLAALAVSISRHAGVAMTNIFINYQQAHSGKVFDNGEIVHW